jgi:hypothetical protein
VVIPVSAGWLNPLGSSNAQGHSVDANDVLTFCVCKSLNCLALFCWLLNWSVICATKLCVIFSLLYTHNASCFPVTPWAPT